MAMPQVGEPAPDFTLPSETGERVLVRDFRGWPRARGAGNPLRPMIVFRNRRPLPQSFRASQVWGEGVSGASGACLLPRQISSESEQLL